MANGTATTAASTATAGLAPTLNITHYMPDKLTRERYLVWRNGMQLVFEKLKILDVVLGTKARPKPADEKKPTDEETKAMEAWDSLDLDARLLITNRVADEFIVKIEHLPTAATVWTTLANSCRVQGSLGTIYWIRRMVGMRYDETTDLQVHISAMLGCVRELSFISFKMPDDVTAALLLNSMPDSYEPVTASLPGSNLKIDKVRARLLEEYHRRKERSATAETDNALLGRPGAKLYCTHCKRDNHVADDCWSRGGKKEGQGPHQKKKQKKKKGAKAHVAKDDDSEKSTTEHSMFIAEQAYSAREVSAYAAGCPNSTDLIISADDEAALISRLANTPIIIDSGTTSHIHPTLSDFSDLDSRDSSQISGINGKLASKGRGTFSLQVRRPDGRKSRLRLRETLFAPDAQVTLISVSRMDTAGLRTVFANGKCTITDRQTREVIATATMRDRLYHLDVADESTPDRSHLAQTPSDLELWHHRLNHLGYESLRTLVRRKMVTGLKIADLNAATECCPSCLAGKMHRLPFPKDATRATQIMDLVHSDVWGDASVDSLGGSRYYVSFTDDYSRYTYVFTLKRKSDAFDAFKRWLALAENQTGRKLKAIRTDNGGEYVSNEWDKYLSERGIRRQLTAPYTSPQNGVAERLNRTIMERVRACLAAASLPFSLWAEAVAAVVYTKNMCPTVALKSKTPYEVWFGKKPDISHLRIFGSTCYVHVPSAIQTSKLHPRATKAIFVGYPDESKAWRVYIPGQRKITRSRDVYFDERLPTPPATNPQSTQPSEGEILDIILQDTHRAPEVPQPETPPSATPDDAQPQNEESIAPSEEPHDTPSPSPPTPEAPPAPRPLRRGSRERKQHWKLREGAKLAEADQVFEQFTEPDHDDDYIYYVSLGDTPSYSQAMKSEDAPKWMSAMKEEIDAIYGLGTFELVPLPPGRKAIGCKWVFRIKRDASGAITRYKARLVAQGFYQLPGIDFGETFAPVARIESLRILFALAAIYDWEIGQMDVKNAFLNGELKEEIYMDQPKGFVAEGKAGYVWRLLKSLYGLKQASRVWYQKFRAVLLKLGFHPLLADPCVFVRILEKRLSIIACHVDDLGLFCNSVAILTTLKAELKAEFEMTDLGEMKLIVGLAVTRDRSKRTITISQSHYVEKFTDRFGDDAFTGKAITPLAAGAQLTKAQCPSTDAERDAMKNIPYQIAVGSIMYAAICTRPDLSHSVGLASQFSSNPGPAHWAAVKRILRHSNATKTLGLTFGGLGKAIDLEVYCDADYAQDPDKRRSTTGYVCRIAGGAVSYASRKQGCVTTSTVEAEYVAACSAAKEVVWIRLFLSEIGFPQLSPTPMYIDNSGSLRLTQDNTLHNRTKHIDVQYHYIRELVEQNVIAPEHVPSDKNISDIFTKPLPFDKHSFFVPQLGLMPVEGEC